MKSCKETIQVISESMDDKQPFFKRLALKFHLMMCGLCTQYKDQIKFLRKASRAYRKKIDETQDESPQLSPDTRDRIKEALRIDEQN